MCRSSGNGGLARSTNRTEAIQSIVEDVVACRACPRLIEHCAKVAREKRRQYSEWQYWGGPVPSFGDPEARLLIVGLAPAAHGANRTGRMFTGDRSGDWLYDALHVVGMANQARSVAADDGLILSDAYVSAAAHCAPPGNRPTTDELERCRPYLVRELDALTRLRVVLALGQIGMLAFFKAWQASGRTLPKPRPRFGHGAVSKLDERITLVTSYHPSQQNTFTGRLTRRMFRGVFRQVVCQLDQVA